MKNNIITITDSYKLSHYKQYPKGYTNVYSYFESRIGAKYDETVFFGLQYLLKEYLAGTVVTKEKIAQAKRVSDGHVGANVFNEIGWNYILDKYQGKLPVRIKAVAEGTPIPVSNILMSVEVTDDNVAWLTNYIESLLVHTWYPSTVATISRHNKKNIFKSLEKTGDPAGIDFKLHDFGLRGVSSLESACTGGGAHLTNFKGTDTVPAILFLEDYYNANEMPGFSIPASEHSTITSWGREHEIDAMRNMLEQYPTGLVACVSDSYDIYNACGNIWGQALRDLIMKREGTLVIRPDSGDPIKLIPDIMHILLDKFGATRNSKGYYVLDPHVRVIQGDGITPETIPPILEELNKCGYSTDNLAFGSGGGLLQKCDRDTQRFAFKCSEIIVNGEAREVFKQPITDGSKTSKKGRLALVKDSTGKFETISENKLGDHENLLKTVFENGEIIKEYGLTEIRKNNTI